MAESQTPEFDQSKEMSRKAAEITFARVKSYQDLYAETEEEGERQFLEQTKKLWKEFAVHGILGRDPESKKIGLLPRTDSDGRCALALLRLAGISTEDIVYVSPGQSVSGRINIDTGGKSGVVVDYLGTEPEDEGTKTSYLDHHGEASSRDTSATKISYEVLTSLGLLKREPYLDRMVTFITQMDNRTFPDEEKYYKDSWRTVLGLYRFMDFERLQLFFRSGRKPTDILSEGHLALLGLRERSEKQKENVEKSLAKLEEMDKDGFIVDSPYYGRIAVDIEGQVRGGSVAAKAYDCQAYMVWNYWENSFFFSSSRHIRHEFEQGLNIRGTMWVKSRGEEKLTMRLSQVLKTVTGGKFVPRDGLAEYLSREQK